MPVRDHVWVRRDGAPVGTLQRGIADEAVELPAGQFLTLLTEELGRVNYGPRIGEPKGLIGTPLLDGKPIPGPWRVRTFDVAGLGAAVAAAPSAPRLLRDGRVVGPVGLRGSFELTAPADLFLDTRGWGKGYAFVNGFFLGRYWRRGPQRTLYVPSPVTRAGENHLVVVELEQAVDATARFLPRPDLGHEVE